MAIIQYNDNVFKDTNVYGDNIYLAGNRGQGCGTIWFSSVKQAKKAFEKDGAITGSKLYDCEKCACHYSIIDKQQKKYPEFACHETKKNYAKQFR